MATNETPASFDLGIVGGGIAGLMLAIAMNKHAPHIPITLYEAASKFGEIGAGVALSPNAIRALELIDPQARAGLEKRSSRNGFDSKADTWFDFRCGLNNPDRGIKDGELIVSVQFEGEAKKYGRGMVHRAQFLDEMVTLLPEGIAQFGKRVLALEEGNDDVTLTFSDGSTASHSAIIGCDGIKSKVRQHVLGKDHPAAHAKFTGKYCYRGLIPMDKASKALGDEIAQNSHMHLGHGGHVLTFPVAGGTIMNVVAFTSADEWKSEEWVTHVDLEKMRGDFEGWGENVTNIINLMEKPDIWALFNHKPAPFYARGRICLSGDAAHASTPHQGVGAGMAIEDAWTMSQILKEVHNIDQLIAALQAFDTIRRPRTQKVVTSSRDCGQLWDMELEGVGDDLRKLNENASNRLKWIWYNDIDRDVKDMKRLYQAVLDQ